MLNNNDNMQCFIQEYVVIENNEEEESLLCIYYNLLPSFVDVKEFVNYVGVISCQNLSCIVKNSIISGIRFRRVYINPIVRI